MVARKEALNEKWRRLEVRPPEAVPSDCAIYKQYRHNQRRGHTGIMEKIAILAGDTWVNNMQYINTFNLVFNLAHKGS